MLRSTQVRPFLREVEPEEAAGGRGRRHPDAGRGAEHGAPASRLEVEFLAERNGRVVAFLDRLCRLVRRLEGRPRATVVEALRRQERRVRDARRLDGVAKSLLDRCRFRPPPGAERAEEIRDALFRARGRDWPPTPGSLRTPYREAARELDMDEARIDELLYADRPDARLLERAPRFGGERLLSLYNLDLARGVLLDAVRVEVTARGGWRDIFRAVKLARLMYRLERVEGTGARGRKTGATYRVELTGPAARYLKNSRRYGARFARVVPALARAPGWRLEADVERDGRRLRFELDGGAPLAGARGRGRPSYDSGFERSLAREFEEKLGAERDGWTLAREVTPVDLGEEVLLPDFTLRKDDGREALVEIVGFWASGYLERKLRKVRAAGLDNLLLVVYRDLGVGEDDELERAFPGRVLRFARKPVIRDVMEAVERVAARPGDD